MSLPSHPNAALRLFEMSKLQEEETRAKEATQRAAEQRRRQMEDEERARRIAEAVNRRVGPLTISLFHLIFTQTLL